MERALDLSRQSLTTLAQVPRDVVRHSERDGEPYALSLAQNRLTSLRDVHIFRHVVQLDISGNQLESLDGVDALAQLESLNVARNRLASVDALAALARLRVLNVAENELTQLDVLRGLPSLVALDVSYNRIAKWPQLSQLRMLESVDLSSNQLEALPVSAAARAFPPSLRRLSLVKNHIHELCGLAALGMFLQQLQTIKVDGNPATTRVLRDGGCLDFLWVNLFASVAFTPSGAGMRRDDFVVPVGVVEAVEDAIERGDEATLHQFLLTGDVATRVATSAAYYPPPPPMPREQSSRVKVDEVSRPLPSDAFAQPPKSTASSVTSGADGLSKESKMEMWKRMMDERKAQDQRDRAALVATATATATPAPLEPTPPIARTPPPPAPVVAPKPSQPEARQPHVPDREPPPPPSGTTVASTKRREVPSAATATAAASPHIDALAAQVKTLGDQLASVRKYVNVWIKREQLTRVAAARRLQRIVRRHQWQRQLKQLIQHSRRRREHEFGVAPMSSPGKWLAAALVPVSQRHLHVYAVAIQRHVRGWLTRFRVSRLLYYSDAAVRIQRAWRRRRSERFKVKRELGLLVRGKASRGSANSGRALADTVAALVCDVRQLQRVFVVQEQALARQWRELAYHRRLVETACAPSAVKLQSLWRGYAVRRTHKFTTRTSVSTTKESVSRDAEVVALRAELEALKQVVQRLVEKHES